MTILNPDEASMHESLSVLLYGASKAGKSTTAITAPAPRLLLDAEHGHKFLNAKMIYWDPTTEVPPEPSESWDTTVVIVRNFDTIMKVYQWLQSGAHPFRSVIVDSISEVQAKCLEQVAGRDALQMQQWGMVLRAMNGVMRDLRDLTTHPTNPLRAVVLTAMATDKGGHLAPYLQGQSATIAPYIFDITGYLAAETYTHPDPTQPPYTARRLYIGPNPKWVSGERVGGKLGEIVEQDDLNIEEMIKRVYAKPNNQEGTQ